MGVIRPLAFCTAVGMSKCTCRVWIPTAELVRKCLKHRLFLSHSFRFHAQVAKKDQCLAFLRELKNLSNQGALHPSDGYRSRTIASEASQDAWEMSPCRNPSWPGPQSTTELFFHPELSDTVGTSICHPLG